MVMTKEQEFNEGFSERQVCEIIKLYVKDDVNGKQLAIRFGTESQTIYRVLHNYGFNFGHTAGMSDVRGTFQPIFHQYHYTEKQIDDCIYRYMKDYRSKYQKEEVKYYLQRMLFDLGEQLEEKQERISKRTPERILERTWESTQESTPDTSEKPDVTNVIKIAAVVLLILFGISVLSRACAFVGDKLNGATRFFSNDYQFDAFTYQGVLYGGNQKWGRPNGPCAGIPARANGTEYSLGKYEGGKLNGLGIVCYSDIPLQADYSEHREASAFDGARLRIRMGQMKDGVLKGYGVVYNSADEIIIGKYKDGKLAKYGCKIALDADGNILSVEIMKGDKVKKEFKGGTYKGMTYEPEEGRIVIDDFEFTISAGKISMKTEGAVMEVKDRQWTFDWFNPDTEEGIYMDYVLGEKVKCQVMTNDSQGLLVNESETPITYGKESSTVEAQ